MQDKTSLRHSGVGNDKVVGIGNFFSEIENVEVDDPGRVWRSIGNAPELGFDSLSLPQELSRSPVVVDFDDRIKEVGRVCRTVYRAAAVDRSLDVSGVSGGEFSEKIAGSTEIGNSITEV